MRKASFVSMLILLVTVTFIAAPLAGSGAQAARKLRVGVVGLEFKGGRSANKIAADIQNALVEDLGKDVRLSVKGIDPGLFGKNRLDIYEDGKATPTEVLKDTDLLLVTWVRLDDRMLTVTIEFIKSDTGEILWKMPVHERHDYSVYPDVRNAARGWIDKYLSSQAEAAPMAPMAPVAPPPSSAPIVPPAPTERKVHAHGVGMMPVQGGNVLLASRGSMALAMRDAAERGLGAVVDVLAIPDLQRRDIVATVATTLQNVSVITEERQGNVYVTEIECDVVIPEAIKKGFPTPAPQESTGMNAAVQTFKRGFINWETGIITVRGRGRLAGTDPRSVELARRAARVDAYASAIEIIQGMRFDPDSKINEQIALNAQRGFRIRALVQGAEVVGSQQLDPNNYEVTVEVPMRGIKGITTVFDDLFKWQPSTPPPLDGEPEPSPGEAGATGLIIDARGKGAMPAFCPVVVDESGVVVYGVGGLPQSVITQRGGAAYTAGEPSGTNGAWLGPNPLRIQALNFETAPQVAATGPGAWLSTPIAKFLNPAVYLAQAAQTVVLRQGKKPAKVKATAVGGSNKAKIVVSSSSAAQIKRTNKKTNYLGQARVVIITDSMVGATEGRRILPAQPTKVAKVR